MPNGDSRVLAGAASISAINFVAPLFLVHGPFDTGGSEIVLFVHSAVGTATTGKYSSSSRGSIPLPIMFKDKRKGFCQAHLPMHRFERDSDKGLPEKLPMDEAWISKGELLGTMMKWVRFHCYVLARNGSRGSAALVRGRGKELIRGIEAMLAEENTLSVAKASVVIVRGCFRSLAPNSKVRCLTLKTFFREIGEDIVNRAAFNTCLNYVYQLKSRSRSTLDDFVSFPFNGALSMEYSDASNKERFTFSQLRINQNGSLTLKNATNDLECTLDQDKVIDFSGFRLRKPVFLICRGGLAAEQIARLGRTITIPWYLDVEFIQDSQKSLGEHDAVFEEVISPPKSTSLSRRPIQFGGQGVRLNPGGYSLLDYETKGIRAWIGACLGIIDLDQAFCDLLSKVITLNFYSTNSKCTNETRAITICEYLVRNSHSLLPRETFDRVLQEEYLVTRNAAEIRGDDIQDLLAGIALFSVLCRLPMRGGSLEGRSQLLAHISLPEWLLKGKTLDLSLLANTVLAISRSISDHFLKVTKGTLNLLQQGFETSSLLKSFGAETKHNDSSLLWEKLNASTIVLRTEMGGDAEHRKEFIESSRVYRVFFKRYLAALVQDWCSYSTYCLKASLPALALLVSEQELKIVISDILEKRSEVKMLSAKSVWR